MSICDLPPSLSLVPAKDTKSYYPNFDGSTSNRGSLGYFWNRPKGHRTFDDILSYRLDSPSRRKLCTLSLTLASKRIRLTRFLSTRKLRSAPTGRHEFQ